MKTSALRAVIASAIFLLLLTQIFAAPPAPPDTTSLGVNLNDSFTYIVSTLTLPPEGAVIMGPGIYSDIEFELGLGDTFTMTIQNLTVGNFLGTDHHLEVTLNNGSHSIITPSMLAPGSGPVSFTNWSSWEPQMNNDPEAYFKSTDYLNHTTTQDYAEYNVDYWLGTFINASTTIYLRAWALYDVNTGVFIKQGVKTYNIWKLGLGLADFEWETSRVGYVKPPPPSSTTTTTTTSSSTTSNTTTTTASNSTTTSSTTTPTVPTSSTTTTTTATTTSSTTTGTATGSNTDTSTVTTTTTPTTSTTTTTTTTAVPPVDTNTTATTDPATNPAVNTTTTSSSRTLATTTTGSTLSRNSTTTTTESRGDPIEDAGPTSSITPEVPGFGLFLSFTAFVAVIGLIKYKKY